MSTLRFPAAVRPVSLPLVAGLFLGAALSAPAQADPVTRQDVTVNGVAAIRFAWTDSRGLPRTVSIKKEGGGNPGHGGYAVQMTYQTTINGVLQTVTVNPAESGEGFGYFVSHERYRDFTDGTNLTIAEKIFGVNDSPLGRNLPASLAVAAQTDPSKMAIYISTTYHHYGTVAPIPKNAAGKDVRRTPVDKTQLADYQIPVRIVWFFETGKDYPRIRNRVDLTNIGPDLINFDVRGPYGAMYFAPNQARIGYVMWGDRYRFYNTTGPLTRNSSWVWNTPNSGARFTALISGYYEMGLFEPLPFASSRLTDGSSDGRGHASTSYTCTEQSEVLPCDYEWPYQSAQYSLPYNNNNATTNYPKIAWGSSPFYGTGPSLTAVYDTPNSSEAFNGYANGILTYDVCVVLGQTITGGLTFAASRNASAYNCAAQ